MVRDLILRVATQADFYMQGSCFNKIDNRKMSIEIYRIFV